MMSQASAAANTAGWLKMSHVGIYIPASEMRGEDIGKSYSSRIFGGFDMQPGLLTLDVAGSGVNLGADLE
jgi:hypothetical protein